MNKWSLGIGSESATGQDFEVVGINEGDKDPLYVVHIPQNNPLEYVLYSEGRQRVTETHTEKSSKQKVLKKGCPKQMLWSNQVKRKDRKLVSGGSLLFSSLRLCQNLITHLKASGLWSTSMTGLLPS